MVPSAHVCDASSGKNFAVYRVQIREWLILWHVIKLAGFAGWLVGWLAAPALKERHHVIIKCDTLYTFGACLGRSVTARRKGASFKQLAEGEYIISKVLLHRVREP